IRRCDSVVESVHLAGNREKIQNQIENPGRLPVLNTAIAQNNQPSGILDLVLNLFAVSRKMNTLDDAVAATNMLSKSSQQMSLPIVHNMTIMAEQGEELAKAADTSNAAQLTQEKRELDALTNKFKE